MAEHRQWKRIIMVGVKVYAALCTLLVTAFLGLMLWAAWTPAAPGQPGAVGFREAGEAPGFAPVELRYDLPQTSTDRNDVSRWGSGNFRESSPSQLDASAKQSQPLHSVTNQPPVAAGSAR